MTWTAGDWYVLYVVMPWALAAMVAERVRLRRRARR